MAAALLQPQSQAVEQAPTPKEAADKGLELYRQFITEKNFETYGLKSFNEKEATQRGDSMRIFSVGLNQLRQFQHDKDDPEKLLVDTKREIFAITVGGEVRYALTVTQFETQGNWTVTKLGSADLAKLLFKPEYRTSESSFVVRIPALYLSFVGDRTGGKRTLTPIANLRKRGPEAGELMLEAGKPLPAKEVFRLLVPAAEKRAKESE